MTTNENKERQELFDLLDFSDAKKEVILNNLINSQKLYDPIDISQDVYKDTLIDKWCQDLPDLSGSKLLIKKMIASPINDKNILLLRQKNYFKTDNIDFSILKDYENDVLWIYKLNEEVRSNNLIYMLFPSSYGISYINYIDPLIELYHMYKIYFVPLNIIGYPILSLFAPLYYLNRYLCFSISLRSYLNILWKIVKYIFTYSGDIKSTLIKIVSFSFYVFLFVYNVYQSVEYAYMLFKVKSTLYTKISNLNTFVNEAYSIINNLPTNVINLLEPFIKLNYNFYKHRIDVQNNFPSIYKIWKDKNLKNSISELLVAIYTIDIINAVSKLIYSLPNDRSWSLVSYSQETTKMWNMKNPLLYDKQTPNPVSLSKNMIITGPNAAGKTTYVKSILSNIILSQTFGIAYAMQSQCIIYDNIISFMRISDELGSKSYFEAEAEYCLKMMKKAKELSAQKKKGLFLMDEPMHSTPPTEGMSTAYAVAEYIGQLPGATVILTTHFHKLVHLEAEYPDKFINLSVEAIPLPNGGFKFPYHIRRGHSYQCIAIELLSSKDYPQQVIQSAINMKNKICAEILEKTGNVL